MTVSRVCARLIWVVWLAGVTTLPDIAASANEGASESVLQARDSADAAVRKGDYEAAVRAAVALAKALEERHGRGAPQTAAGYALQAKFLLKLERSADARSARDKAVQIVMSATDMPAREKTPLLLSLATCSLDLQDSLTAFALANDAVQLCTVADTEEAGQLAEILKRIAAMHIEKGRTEAAAKAYEAALMAVAKAHGPESDELVELLERIAQFSEEQLRYADAARWYDELVAIRERVLGPTASSVALGLQRSAACRICLGEYAGAEQRLRRALDVATKSQPADPMLQMVVMETLANACAHQGKWEEAEGYARQSLAAAEAAFADTPRQTLPYRTTLATVFALQERNSEAEDVVRQALAIVEQSAGAIDIEFVTALNNLGFLVWNTGRHDDADKIFGQLLKASEAQFGEDDLITAIVGGNHACNCFYQRRYDEAVDVLEKALSVTRATLGEHHFRTAMVLINLATTEAARGNVRRAAELNDEGCRGLARQIRNQLAALSPREQLRLLRGQYAIGYQAALTMGLLWREEHGVPELSASWLANGKAIAHEASAQRAVAALQFGRNGTSESADASSRSVDHWVELAMIREQIPADAVLVDIARFDVFNYASSRKGDDWKPARYAAWIIPPAGKGTVKVVDVGDAATNDADIAAYRLAIREMALRGGGKVAGNVEADAERSLNQFAAPLVARILEPILDGIKTAGCEDGVEELIISPDGELWLVPWAALPLSDGRYLVEQYAVTTVTSARDLMPVDGHGEALTAPRVFADPDYDLSREEHDEEVRALAAESEPTPFILHDVSFADGAGVRSTTADKKWERLPGSLAEAVRVTPIMEKVSGVRPLTFTGAQAIEDRVKQSRSPYMLHFATHGFCFPDQVASTAVGERASITSAAGRPVQGLTTLDGEPLEEPLLRCGLMLAGCNSGLREGEESMSDGCLTGQEVVTLDLRGTKLVILSACDTGLGRVQYGEGVAGLRQAFLIAGAECVLANLWPVRDDQAEQAVVAFFGELAKGGSKAAALHTAQCAMIRQRRASGGAAHPAFWAAFELTGR